MFQDLNEMATLFQLRFRYNPIQLLVTSNQLREERSERIFPAKSSFEVGLHSLINSHSRMPQICVQFPS